jgi:hypothetical protein
VQEDDIWAMVIAEEHRQQAQAAWDVHQVRPIAHACSDEGGLKGHPGSCRQWRLAVEQVQRVLPDLRIEQAQDALRGVAKFRRRRPAAE